MLFLALLGAVPYVTCRRRSSQPQDVFASFRVELVEGAAEQLRDCRAHLAQRRAGPIVQLDEIKALLERVVRMAELVMMSLLCD